MNFGKSSDRIKLENIINQKLSTAINNSITQKLNSNISNLGTIRQTIKFNFEDCDVSDLNITNDTVVNLKALSTTQFQAYQKSVDEVVSNLKQTSKLDEKIIENALKEVVSEARKVIPGINFQSDERSREFINQLTADVKFEADRSQLQAYDQKSLNEMDISQAVESTCKRSKLMNLNWLQVAKIDAVIENYAMFMSQLLANSKAINQVTQETSATLEKKTDTLYWALGIGGIVILIIIILVIIGVLFYFLRPKPPNTGENSSQSDTSSVSETTLSTPSL